MKCCWLAPGVVLALAVGCASSVGLTVDVRTDYVAREEFGVIRTELSTTAFSSTAIVGTPVQLAVAPTSDFLAGTRVSEFRPIAPGAYWVRVSLLSASGVVIARRITEVHIAGPLAITAVISRSCEDAICPPAGSPDLIACNGGICVDPRCTPEMPERCGDGQCRRDADCVGGPAGMCVRPVCEGGACLYGADDALCGAGRYCTAAFACAALPDGGTSMDASRPDASGPQGDASGPDVGCLSGPACCAGATCAPGTACIAGSCAPCGGRGQPCCAGDACGASLACASGRCACGGRDQPCCDASTCDANTSCISGTCRCGLDSQVCCAGRVCDDGSLCSDTGFGPICLCGRDGQICCPGRVCNDGSLCTDTGFGPICLCGRDGQICCPGRVCNDGSLCTDTGFGPICLCGSNGQVCCTGRVCTDGTRCRDTGFGPICLP